MKRSRIGHLAAVDESCSQHLGRVLRSYLSLGGIANARMLDVLTPVLLETTASRTVRRLDGEIPSLRGNDTG